MQAKSEQYGNNGRLYAYIETTGGVANCYAALQHAKYIGSENDAKQLERNARRHVQLATAEPQEVCCCFA